MDKYKLKTLKNIIKYNKKIIKENDENLNKSIDNIITLKYEGHSIWNPFLDETSRNRVDPERKYGIKKIKKFIEAYNKKVMGE